MSGYPTFPGNLPTGGGQPTGSGPAYPPASPFSDAPNPYFNNPYGPGPGAVPPPRSTGLWWFLGCGGLASVLLCCGLCGGFVFWGFQLTEQEIADQLRDNPKLVEHVGAVESFDHDWSALLSDESDGDYDVFIVRGSKGSGKVIVEHSSDPGEVEEIYSAVLELPSGERIDLLEEAPPSEMVPEPQ